VALYEGWGVVGYCFGSMQNQIDIFLYVYMHLKAGLIRGVAFGWRGLIRRELDRGRTYSSTMISQNNIYLFVPASRIMSWSG
jgi:hypothetical protein